MSTFDRRISRAALNVALACVLLMAAAVEAAPPRDLDRYAQRALETFESPGMVITVVERGQPSIVRAYGVRRMGEPAKVDEQTLFAIGSTTKAFTSAVLAGLIDEGKLAWDTKVQDVLPGFKMYDPYASAEMTIRDLLVHRSGLGPGAGDLLFYPPTTLGRDDIVHRLRYIKPATSFRSGYAYDNLLYIVAGQVIAALAGKSWEEVVRARILDPLQMSQTSTSSTLPRNANRAWPHVRMSDEMRGDGPMTPLGNVITLDNAAAAGALNTNGAEMAHWLRVQLNRGLDPRTNARIYSEAQAREMWSAHTPMPIATNPAGLALAQANFRAYALGWVVSDYRGERLVAHGGGVPGSVTLVAILPAKEVAFAIMTNSEEVGALAAVQYRLLDHYLGLSSPDWIAAQSEVHKARIARGREMLASTAASQTAELQSSGPSLPIANYAGRYRDDWYGLAQIESAEDGLHIRFEHTAALSGKLEHVRHDTFRTRFGDRAIEDAYVTFALNPDGSIETMKMRAISPLADFSFDYHDLLFKPEH